MPLIYIVEDDPNIRDLESYALKNSGFEVSGFSNSVDFHSCCAEIPPDLVLLDIMLPGDDGLKILQTLRKSDLTKRIPVIMVTARSTELDKIKGLESGADDYIAKPFGVMEMVSRVKAVLRRVIPEERDEIYSYGSVELNDLKHVVTVGNNVCELTFKEYELLKYLLSNVDIVLSREKIMDKIWGLDYEGESRTVDMHIKTLRHKLGDSGEIIKTVRNVGYKIGE